MHRRPRCPVQKPSRILANMPGLEMGVHARLVRRGLFDADACQMMARHRIASAIICIAGCSDPELKRFPLQSRSRRTSVAFSGRRWRRTFAISPSASLHSAPKTIASNHLTFDFTKRPFLTGRFWRKAAARWNVLTEGRTDVCVGPATVKTRRSRGSRFVGGYVALSLPRGPPHHLSGVIEARALIL